MIWNLMEFKTLLSLKIYPHQWSGVPLHFRSQQEDIHSVQSLSCVRLFETP